MYGYNNFYQPMGYRQSAAPMPPQMPQPQEETLYVPNQQAAEAYLMAPNSYVRLWDSNLPVFYEKRTDMQGRPLPIKRFEYREVAEVQQQPEYVTRKEFEDFMAKFTGGEQHE